MRRGSIDNHHFYLTTYFYPLKSPIPLNEELEYFFDNPRTDDEIALIKQAFESTLFTNKPKILSGPTQFSRGKDRSIHSGLKIISENNTDYINDNQDLLESDPLLYLVKTAIIIRYENDEILESQQEIEKKKEEEESILYLSNQPSERRKNEVVAMVSIISLLLNADDIREGRYDGETFLSTSVKDLAYEYYNQDLYHHVNRYISDCHRQDKHRLCNRKIAFPDIEKLSRQIGILIKNDEIRKLKLFYIGELITITNQTDDPKIKIMLMSSIFECLLVKGNQSLSEQYSLKLAHILSHIRSKSEISKFKKFFRELYNLRSKIAHGDYEEINKIIGKRKKKLIQSSKKPQFYEENDNIWNWYVFAFYGILYDVLSYYLSNINSVEEVRDMSVKTNGFVLLCNQLLDKVKKLLGTQLK